MMFRDTLALCLFALLATSTTSVAQEPAAEKTAAEKPAAEKPAAEKPAAPDGRALAAQHVKAGKRMLDLGEYDKAIAEYEAAFALIPHPQMLFNLGQAHQRKGDKVKAAAHYDKYLAIESKGPSVDQAREMLAMLKEAIAKDAAGPPPMAKVTVTSSPPGDVQIDGKLVGKSPYVGEVMPGKHVFEVLRPGYLRHRETVEVKADQAYTVKASLLVDQAAQSSWYKSPWLWVGVGVAAGIVTAVILASRKTETTPDDPMVMMRPPRR